MKIVDENNWDAELEIMLKKTKRITDFQRLIIYSTGDMHNDYLHWNSSNFAICHVCERM